MTDFELYFSQVYDGRIVACEKMKKVSEILLERYAKPEQFHFDEKIAQRHIDFIQTFCHLPSGRLGVPFKLELFQRARFQAVFGFVDDDGMRQYQEVFIVEGRKNGKTSENSAVELDMLCNDGEGAPQIYNVATKLDQASLGFNAAWKMVQQSPDLRKHIRKRKSDLYFAANMGIIKPLAANTNGLDGLDISCAVIDELAAIKNRDLYDLIKQGFSARRQPLLFVITTNGFVRFGVFDAQYDYAAKVLAAPDDPHNQRFLPFIYELDSEDEWTNEDMWAKANPGIDAIKSREYLREMVAKAKIDPAFKPTVLVKDFNLPQTSSAAWLTYDEANNEERWDIAFDYCIGGFDAADSIDLNAATALFMRPNDPRIYRRSMYWIPQSVIDKQQSDGNRSERDSVPYELWEQQGYIRVVPGARVDKKVILDWFIELREQGYYARYIGYDPWHIDDSLLRAFYSEFGRDSMISVRQGVITLSQPMKDAKADMREGLVVYNNNPIDKWCLLNTAVKTDVNGNWQPIKDVDRFHRIDGSIAFLCAYYVMHNKGDDYINLNDEYQGG